MKKNMNHFFQTETPEFHEKKRLLGTAVGCVLPIVRCRDVIKQLLRSENEDYIFHLAKHFQQPARQSEQSRAGVDRSCLGVRS